VNSYFVIFWRKKSIPHTHTHTHTHVVHPSLYYQFKENVTSVQCINLDNEVTKLTDLIIVYINLLNWIELNKQLWFTNNQKNQWLSLYFSHCLIRSLKFWSLINNNKKYVFTSRCPCLSSSVIWFSGMYISSVSWSTIIQWRWLKVPRPTSWPLMRTLKPELNLT